ncbi:MAG TPA: dolichyl-phosphate beta-D-mannosyltransferase [Gammaproteobacteria bacterium]|jgi:dolichol-phosphate mannosyltransferase|nr:dolichyl-phosphate beta-D-mannosyltransferase [Acidiferrobacteraceae bacterium]MDP6398113.1 polyprenol monophosphomannose synthase [Arenicellales bacterium]HCX88736.1 dolichyl-phosphate beta-D-mannosyltransferase [Gammaproteobacteria bacterium]MDP6550826.1 polyprenol monophosphomannose synthase [Arenicellales bacterium]MDP6792247.1 polyprenol monophosphomannose synthase [Arenicellales bacterium]|tara:strand:+ start:4227 stop:4931 length:705 start_codon:yes stop_codon:yes gene_type:complete
MPSPLVLIPTYDERGNLPSFVSAVRSALPGADILVIDDNSPDGTGALADEIAGEDIHVQVLHRDKKEGLGRAYLAGFAWALERDYSHVFEIDADFSHNPKDLPRLLEATENADVALGCRWMPGGGVSGWPWSRLALSRFGNLYARLILGAPYRDLTGGFKCFRREALETLGLNKIRSVGYGFQIETTWRALQRGLCVVEVPIHFTDRTVGVSKMSGQTFKEAFVLVWRLRLGRS